MIPAEIQRRLDDLFALVASLPEKESRTKQHWGALRSQIGGVMAAIGFASEDDGDARRILAARELEGTRRAVVELLATHPEVPIHAFPLPGPAWAKRRWLGLEPPGPLFEGEPTLYARLREADEEVVVEELLPALPRDRRIEVLADLLMLESDFDGSVELVDMLRRELREIPATMGEWGQRMAALLSSFVGEPWEHHEARFGVRPEVFNAVLHAIVRAGGPIEPASEALLVLDNYPHEHETLRACIAAIAEPRREAAVVAALERVPTDVVAEIVQGGLECDDRALRRALIAALAEKPEAKSTTAPTKSTKAAPKSSKAPAKSSKAPTKAR